MRIESFENKKNAAIAAAVLINSELEQRSEKPTLLLLSGGSALAVLEQIDQALLGPHVTITLADDRYSDHDEDSNYKGIAATGFFDDARANGANVISTEPRADELRESYAARFSQELEAHRLSYTIAICGVGEGTHTAGIFPLEAAEFEAVYGSGKMVGHLTQTTKAPPERISITPGFIEGRVSTCIIFSVGKGKREYLLNMLQDGSIHEAPARLFMSHPNATLFTDQVL